MQNTVAEPLTKTNLVHVSVAVIVRDGKVLIAKRPEHVHQGGLWEFPGGKLEEDETIESALYREINEELGIQIQHSRPLIKLTHHYSDKSVLLETRLVTTFSGRDYSSEQEHLGREGQKVRWVDVKHLDQFQFPAANKPIIDALVLPETYAISPDISEQGDFLQQENAFIRQFCQVSQQHSLIQLRVKSPGQEQLNSLVRKIVALPERKCTRILLNSAMPVEHELIQSADGIHLTGYHLQSDDYIKWHREQFPEKIMAASCHSQQDIVRANDQKLDFIVLSPVQFTQSHPEQEPLGWEQLGKLIDTANMPVYALGGMSENDIVQAQQQGAQGIAAIRSLWNFKE